MGVGDGLLRRYVDDLLDRADVRIGGDRPWDIQVHDERLYRRVLLHGSLGLGEAYMDEWWDCPQLDAFFHRVLAAGLDRRVRLSIPWVRELVKAAVVNLQKASRAFDVGREHYDLGTDLYRAMLDPTMTYSCGYWSDAKDLEQAQRAKHDLVCRKLGIEPGMRVLDIGCGWGAFAEHAANRYKADVVGLTVSEDQARYVRRACRELPVEVRLMDYRDLTAADGPFDRVVSIGMFEHVGPKNHSAFMEVAHEVLADDGMMLLHTIGAPNSGGTPDPWIERYIFPNGQLPSMAEIASSAEGWFTVEDWHNFGADYDTTLMAWCANFEAAWDDLSDSYDERFRRMWRYYLLASAGAFRARRLQLWQIVMARGLGVPGGYTSIR